LSCAGIIVKLEKNEYLVVSSGAKIKFPPEFDIRAQEGVFAGETWVGGADLPVIRDGGNYVLSFKEPKVVKIYINYD
jgi:hypothetical protein